MATRPSGYSHAYIMPCSRGDCQIGVGFDTIRGDISRFLVQLQYTKQFFPMQWTEIARFDHNPSNPSGHDIRKEGIHIDVVRRHGRDIKFKPNYGNIPSNLGYVIAACINYFDNNAKYFVDIHTGQQSPSSPPSINP